MLWCLFRQKHFDWHFCTKITIENKFIACHLAHMGKPWKWDSWPGIWAHFGSWGNIILSFSLVDEEKGRVKIELEMFERSIRWRMAVLEISSVLLLSRVGIFVTPWTAACQASLSITNPLCLPKLSSIESVMPSNNLILCRPLLLLPSIFPNTRVFSNESALHIRWPEYWSFSFNISPSSEHSGLISFRMDWLDLIAVQGTLKSLLQHHSSKASIFQRSAFFTVPTLTSIHDHWKNHSLD